MAIFGKWTQYIERTGYIIHIYADLLKTVVLLHKAVTFFFQDSLYIFFDYLYVYAKSVKTISKP